MSEPPVDIWKNCYPSNWRGLLANQDHPAKFSSRLIERIYNHLSFERVFDRPGAVVDPFAGIATGALFAVTRGIPWVGVDVEPENVLAGQKNIAYWRERFGPHLPDYGPATEILGDSQFLTYGITRAGFPVDRVAAVVSSPPFLQSTGGSRETATGDGPIDKRLLRRHAAGNAAVGYGNAPGQIAGLAPVDFWETAGRILAQVRAICDPETRVVWVLKGYVKNGEYIDFPGSWRQLSELSGFRTVHIHHAVFTKNAVSQMTIDGGSVDQSTTSKSFFRRVIEKKYNLPKIDYETVLCMEPKG